tara:strand:- start:7649 stop:8464 length:816 start_codon:yes stop_codon:yes gene_type:complete
MKKITRRTLRRLIYESLNEQESRMKKPELADDQTLEDSIGHTFLNKDKTLAYYVKSASLVIKMAVTGDEKIKINSPQGQEVKRELIGNPNYTLHTGPVYPKSPSNSSTRVKDWNSYINSGSNKTEKQEIKKLWDQIGGQPWYGNASTPDATRPSSPANQKEGFWGWVAWYKAAKMDTELRKKHIQTTRGAISSRDVITLLKSFIDPNARYTTSGDTKRAVSKDSNTLMNTIDGISKGASDTPDLSSQVEKLKESKSRGRLMAERYGRKVYR